MRFGHGEQQITKALPELVEKATNPQLKNALQEHLDITRKQIQRLEQIFRTLNEEIQRRDMQRYEGSDQGGRRSCL